MNSAPNLNLWLIPILPLIGAAINGIFGVRFSKRVVAVVALLFPGSLSRYALWALSHFFGGNAVAYPYNEVHSAGSRSAASPSTTDLPSTSSRPSCCWSLPASAS